LDEKQKQFIIDLAKKVKEMDETIKYILKAISELEKVRRPQPPPLQTRTEELKEKYILEYDHYRKKR